MTAERDGERSRHHRRATPAIGIPPDKLESIFDMFTQVDRSLERSQGGLGIGLTLVQAARADARRIDRGAERRRRAGQRIRRAPARIDRRARSRGGRRRRARTSPRTAAASWSSTTTGMPPQSLAMLLQITGHETFTAHDGPAASRRSSEHRPDVVLLDIGLPTLSGYEVCRRIREQPWGREML